MQIKTRINDLEKKVKVLSKKTLDWKRELSRVRKAFEDVLMESEHRQVVVWRRDKAHTEERNRLIKECKKLSEVTKRATWDAAVKVLRYSHRLQ